MITPAMIPWIRAEVAYQQTGDASGDASDRFSASVRWIRGRMDIHPEITEHHRQAPRALREVIRGSRRSKLVTVAGDHFGALNRKNRLADAFRGKRPDLECVFVRASDLHSGLPPILILMWLPPGDAAALRLAGCEVHPG